MKKVYNMDDRKFEFPRLFLKRSFGVSADTCLRCSEIYGYLSFEDVRKDHKYKVTLPIRIPEYNYKLIPADKIEGNVFYACSEFGYSKGIKETKEIGVDLTKLIHAISIDELVKNKEVIKLFLSKLCNHIRFVFFVLDEDKTLRIYCYFHETNQINSLGFPAICPGDMLSGLCNMAILGAWSRDLARGHPMFNDESRFMNYTNIIKEDCIRSDV